MLCRRYILTRYPSLQDGAGPRPGVASTVTGIYNRVPARGGLQSTRLRNSKTGRKSIGPIAVSITKIAASPNGAT